MVKPVIRLYLSFCLIALIESPHLLGTTQGEVCLGNITFRTGNFHLQPRKMWMQYVLVSVRASLEYHRHVGNLREKTNKMIQRILPYKFCIGSNSNKSNVTLIMPCAYLYFKSQVPASRTWHILVHGKFMINITIYKSFVPYSDLCAPHNIQIHEGIIMDNNTLIEKFCGHTYMESVYTRYNRASLSVIVNTDIIYPDVTLHAGYQIHDQCVAHRYAMRQVHLPDNITVNIHPRLILNHIKNMVKEFTAIWYLSNHVYTNESREYDDNEKLHEFLSRSGTYYTPKCSNISATKHILTHIQLTVLSYTCTINSSHIKLFHGLISYHIIKWKARPYAALHCNISQHVILAQGMYSTVVLQWLNNDFSLSINMSFRLSFNTEIPQLLTYNGQTQSFTDDSLYKHGSTRFAFIKSVLGSLTFTSFEYSGESPTVRQELMATTGLTVDTGLQRLVITQGIILV